MAEPTRPDDVVTMTHPDIKADPVAVTRRQLELVWADRGWREHKGDGAEAAKSTRQAATTTSKES